MTSIVHPSHEAERKLTFVGVRFDDFYWMFWCSVLHQSPPSSSCSSPTRELLAFDELCRLVREIEIINGIKFHAIISFDFVSRCFCLLVPRTTQQYEGGNGRNSNKDIFEDFTTIEHFFVLLLRLSSAIFTVSRNSFAQWEREGNFFLSFREVAREWILFLKVLKRKHSGSKAWSLFCGREIFSSILKISRFLSQYWLWCLDRDSALFFVYFQTIFRCLIACDVW